MTIEKNVDANGMTLLLTGWLDTQSAPELESVLSGIGAETEKLAFDMSGLEYISSAGIRLLVAAHKKMNGNLTIMNVSADVMDVLSMTGVDKKLNIV